jgi:hypothetical protein
LDLRPFRFTQNGYRKNLNSRSELLFQVFQKSHTSFNNSKNMGRRNTPRDKGVRIR